MHDLRLYSREGCCLCAGLEERLRQLDLDSPSTGAGHRGYRPS
jgi:hypothetical protein